MNRLSGEKAAYLRHSADQRIDWYPWGEEAFERARREDKPVFLSSGGVWCHWCHVMAKETFEDDEVVKLLNEHFVSIKLDRDERPDIDRRYQQAVAAMGSGGGWPLSVFLTPGKEPFFGGTYFPPEDIKGRVGFKKVLRSVAGFYKGNREAITEYVSGLMESLRPERPGHPGSWPINEAMGEAALSSVLSVFDPANGGFGPSSGHGPKFPMPGAIEFLLQRYALTKNEAAGYAARKTLDAMAKGGFHDQIGGGFHRYSTDEAWRIPHFEKMADDNAWLLRNYVDAYGLFGEEYFREVVEGIIRFIREVLSDPDGGFFASQDADVTPDDEGGYFTWTEKDMKEALTDEEFRAASMHLFNEKGSMHHDGSKRVLFVSLEAGEVAKRLGVGPGQARVLIDRAKAKLLEARRKRQTPIIDKTLYTSLNCLLTASFLRAWRVLRDGYLRDFALKTLGTITSRHFAGGVLWHSVGVKAMLEDWVYLIEAHASAYEATGEAQYLKKADELMELCLSKFWDGSGGGFFDSEDEVVGLRLKAIEDIPHPSPNAVGIMLLQKLSFMTGKSLYAERAEAALKAFSSRAEELGIQSAYYFCGLDAYYNMVTLRVESPPGGELAGAALSYTIPFSAIAYSGDQGRVTPCVRKSCYEPISDPSGLKEFFREPEKWAG